MERKHAGLKNENKSGSNHPSRKSSSNSSEINDYKMDKFERESSSERDSFKNKKRPRSESNYAREARDVSNSGLAVKSKSPTRQSRSKSPKIKNKVTSLITEKNANKIFIPGFDGPLVSLSLFIELQHNILSTEAIESAYKDYKTKYDAKKYHSFYVEHKDDEWFKEKYDPESNSKWKNERNTQCAKLAAKFPEGALNMKNLKLQLRESDESNRDVKIMIYGYNKEKEEFEEKERDIILVNKALNVSLNANANVKDLQIDISSSPYFGYDPDKLTLFLHQIPRNVSRSQILEVLKKLPGFIFMSLSEPIKNQNYYRYCWVTFDTEENCDLAYESLNDYRISSDYKISTIKSISSTLKKIRITPSYFEERIGEDLEFTKNFINMFDKEKGIDSSVLNTLTSNDGKETRPRELQLDLQILYLRRVHGFCYYCLEEYEDERALSTKCDNIHLRNYNCLGSRKSEISEANKYEAEWDRNFTRLVTTKLESGETVSSTNKNMALVNEELNKRRNDYCKENTSSVSAEKFLCNICSKMFKGSNFVYNHIVNKHINLIQDTVDKEYYNNLKYENYLSDPSKIYEKYKIISSTDDYLYYLNTMKSFQQGGEVTAPYDVRRPSSGGKYYNKERGGVDRDRRRGRKEFKDYDNPNEGGSSVGTSGRQLISYDDL